MEKEKINVYYSNEIDINNIFATFINEFINCYFVDASNCKYITNKYSVDKFTKEPINPPDKTQEKKPQKNILLLFDISEFSDNLLAEIEDLKLIENGSKVLVVFINSQETKKSAISQYLINLFIKRRKRLSFVKEKIYSNMNILLQKFNNITVIQKVIKDIKTHKFNVLTFQDIESLYYKYSSGDSNTDIQTKLQSYKRKLIRGTMQSGGKRCLTKDEPKPIYTSQIKFNDHDIDRLEKIYDTFKSKSKTDKSKAEPAKYPIQKIDWITNKLVTNPLEVIIKCFNTKLTINASDIEFLKPSNPKDFLKDFEHNITHLSAYAKHYHKTKITILQKIEWGVLRVFNSEFWKNVFKNISELFSNVIDMTVKIIVSVLASAGGITATILNFMNTRDTVKDKIIIILNNDIATLKSNIKEVSNKVLDSFYSNSIKLLRIFIKEKGTLNPTDLEYLSKLELLDAFFKTAYYDNQMILLEIFKQDMINGTEPEVALDNYMCACDYISFNTNAEISLHIDTDIIKTLKFIIKEIKSKSRKFTHLQLRQKLLNIPEFKDIEAISKKQRNTAEELKLKAEQNNKTPDIESINESNSVNDPSFDAYDNGVRIKKDDTELQTYHTPNSIYLYQILLFYIKKSTGVVLGHIEDNENNLLNKIFMDIRNNKEYTAEHDTIKLELNTIIRATETHTRTETEKQTTADKLKAETLSSLIVNKSIINPETNALLTNIMKNDKLICTFIVYENSLSLLNKVLFNSNINYNTIEDKIIPHIIPTQIDKHANIVKYTKLYKSIDEMPDDVKTQLSPYLTSNSLKLRSSDIDVINKFIDLEINLTQEHINYYKEKTAEVKKDDKTLAQTLLSATIAFIQNTTLFVVEDISLIFHDVFSHEAKQKSTKNIVGKARMERERTADEKHKIEKLRQLVKRVYNIKNEDLATHLKNLKNLKTTLNTKVSKVKHLVVNTSKFKDAKVATKISKYDAKIKSKRQELEKIKKSWTKLFKTKKQKQLENNIAELEALKADNIKEFKTKPNYRKVLDEFKTKTNYRKVLAELNKTQNGTQTKMKMSIPLKHVTNANTIRFTKKRNDKLANHNAKLVELRRTLDKLKRSWNPFKTKKIKQLQNNINKLEAEVAKKLDNHIKADETKSAPEISKSVSSKNELFSDAKSNLSTASSEYASAHQSINPK